jgi:hypothetical protein
MAYGFGLTEMEHMYEHRSYNSESADVHSQVLTYCNSPLIPGGRSQSGFNHLTIPYIGIFTEGHTDWASDIEDKYQGALHRSPYQNGLEMTTAKTMIHEIGHSFNIGAADDDFLDHPFRAREVYSGSSDDPTVEKT